MDKKNKKYNQPILELIEFNNADIITLSLGDTIGDGGDNEEDF